MTRMITKEHGSDKGLLAVVLGLVVLGLIILSSASVVVSQQNYGGDSFAYFFRQLIKGVLIGLVFLLIASKINYRHYKKISLIILLASLFLLALVFVPGIGVDHGGATRWLSLGPLTFQPAELTKLAVIIYLAAILDKKKEKVKDFKEGTAPFLIIIIALGILLMLQPDFSTLAVIVLVSTVLFFLSGAKISHLIFMALAAILLFSLLAVNSDYRRDRIMVFLKPELDPLGRGYQIDQALIAIGSGGLFGSGLGHSIQKFNYLPEVLGDSIYAVAAEELGFLGSCLIIGLFLMLAWRGFKIAQRAPDGFARLLASGITFLIIFQAFFNIAAISGIVPLTGMPLPFVSYGGTSMVVLLAGVGILLNISKYTSRA